MRFGNTVGTLTALAFFALAVAAAPAARAMDRCSAGTLSGSYSDQDTGTIVGVGPFAGVNVDTFDGRGKLTIRGVSSVNGSVSPGVSTGTYQVNADCTGTYSVSDAYGDTFTAFFVISDSGNELRIIVTNAGTVINCVAHKQFASSHD